MTKGQRILSTCTCRYLDTDQKNSARDGRACMIWEAVDLLGVQKESRHVPLGLVGVLLKKSDNRYKRNK